MCHDDTIQKKEGVAMLISDKADFNARKVIPLYLVQF